MKFVLCGAMGLFLGSACSESTVPEAAPEPWNLVVSRAEGAEEGDTYNRILVTARQGSVTELSGVLAVDGTSSSWEGTAPTWPAGGPLDVYAVSPVPTDNVLPTAIDLTTGQGTAWLIDYQGQQQTKPGTLTMSHVLAELVVHIRIDSEENPVPANAGISLKAKGTIDYAAKRVEASDDGAVRVPLGDFHQEGQDTHSIEHNWEMETSIVVIPQTIPAGEPCLWFTAGGQQYSFTPGYDLELEAGKVNNLYLGVAAEHTVILINQSDNSIDGFGDGGTQSGEAG